MQHFSHMKKYKQPDFGKKKKAIYHHVSGKQKNDYTCFGISLYLAQSLYHTPRSMVLPRPRQHCEKKGKSWYLF